MMNTKLNTNKLKKLLAFTLIGLNHGNGVLENDVIKALEETKINYGGVELTFSIADAKKEIESLETELKEDGQTLKNRQDSLTAANELAKTEIESDIANIKKNIEKEGNLKKNLEQVLKDVEANQGVLSWFTAPVKFFSDPSYGLVRSKDENKNIELLTKENKEGTLKALLMGLVYAAIIGSGVYYFATLEEDKENKAEPSTYAAAAA